jgi:hypothetical protein
LASRFVSLGVASGKSGRGLPRSKTLSRGTASLECRDVFGFAILHPIKQEDMEREKARIQDIMLKLYGKDLLDEIIE